MRRAMSGNRGYTLIELAIVLAVSGIILAALGSFAHIYKKNQTRQETANNISIVSAALNNYLIRTGAYPCPAPIDVPRSDKWYGIAGNCADIPVETGSCGSGNGHGYCVQKSNRQPAPAMAGWTGRVIKGGVPFRTLGIPEFSATDGYNSRLQYAVTEALAVPRTYNQRGGAIDMQDGNSNPLVTPLPGFTGGTTHYAIISNGPDKAGAYAFETGATVSPCPAPGSTLDAINCQATAPLPPAVYHAAGYADVRGRNHFDDMVMYYSSVQSPVWRVAGALGLDIVDPVGAGDAPADGKVGIGVNTGASGLSAALQVKGNVRARNNINANQICAAGGQANCAMAAPLTSACPPGQTATGFNAGHISCVKDLRVVCPVGELMTGIDALGNIICRAAAGCPATNMQMCWNAAAGRHDQATVPAGALNAVFVTRVSGDSYKEAYECKTSGNSAQWVKTGASGVCFCAPENNVPVTESCSLYKGDDCPDCWTGLASFKRTTICPGGATSRTYTGDTCQCRPYTHTYSRPCPDGLSGSIVYTQDYKCDPANPRAAGKWGEVTQAGSCACAPLMVSQTITCQTAGYSAGYTGSVTQHRQLQCPRSNWVPWRTTSDTCACAAVKQYRNIGCPLPQTGTQSQSQTFNCTTNSWDAWVTESSACAK